MNSRRALVSVVGLSVMCLMGGCLVLEQVEEILGGSISQTAAPEVPREFRGVWVATVSRIDWPPEAGTEEQKKAMVDILDLAVEMNLNGVVFQVRPAADALYESKLEPWSRYLTGSQGKAPEPYYDPLAFAVEQAHKRGLELHAWFNPYRAGLSQNEEYASNSIVKARPELVRKHGSLKWMDPGEDDVKKQSLDVMLDVVKRYDIDAVHMDDYFYPYGAGEGFDDDASWKKYKKSGGTLEKGDWRRKNVDDFIEKLSQEMRKIKPYVKLGISPFGIWRPGYPEGISGMDQYNSIFADPKKWLEKGWVDYLTPQLYWPIDSKGQPFVPLLNWWHEQNVMGRHVWPGLYTGKYDRDEIRNQILESRKSDPKAAGHIHFSQKTFRSDKGAPLKESIYTRRALTPQATWMQCDSPRVLKGKVTAQNDGNLFVSVSPKSLDGSRVWVIQFQADGKWDHEILPVSQTEATIPKASKVVVFGVNRIGAAGEKVSLLND